MSIFYYFIFPSIFSFNLYLAFVYLFCVVLGFQAFNLSYSTVDTLQSVHTFPEV